MKRLKILFLILLILITTNCETIKKTEKRYILPPKPVREELYMKEPYTIQDLAYMIKYYDSLVSEWEEWGEKVNNIVNQ